MPLRSAVCTTSTAACSLNDGPKNELKADAPEAAWCQKNCIPPDNNNAAALTKANGRYNHVGRSKVTVRHRSNDLRIVKAINKRRRKARHADVVVAGREKEGRSSA